MSIMPNNVLAGALCDSYGTTGNGVGTHDCDFCSTKAIDTHDENVCYMKGEYDSYGNDETQLCHWKCLRCTGPTAGECIECRPGINLVLQQDQTITNPMCECIAGYFEGIDPATLEPACVECHVNCDICEDATKECSACKNDTYRYLDLYCEDFCPYPYVENFNVNGSLVCDFLVDDPSQNTMCDPGDYFNYNSGNCETIWSLTGQLGCAYYDQNVGFGECTGCEK